MENQTALVVKDVHINYRNLVHMSIHQSLLKRGELKKAESVEAVKGVSFTVNKGEIVGIIGKNGSGKSTLLRSIAGIFQPDQGIIDTLGNRVSLMAIGIGFTPNNTGRENILKSGMLLGCSPNYIMERMDEIIEFSELGNFIDKQVRTYSSGMYSKLSFAVTAILDTDIMLVDEVLSVGDERFKKKSFAKMKELITDDEKTVLIVSHDAGTLNAFCNRVIWINDGILMKIGETKDVIEEYHEFMRI